MGKSGNRLQRVGWGRGEDRLRTSEANWQKPLRWQRIAAAAGVSLDVFCLSLGDWADNEVPDEWRIDLGSLILATPNLRWLLLTKRIPNVERYLRAIFPNGVPPNVVLGITVALQNEADRDIPRAIAVKKALGIRRLFLSMEPLLGAVELRREWLDDIDLVIVGGESGKNARPIHPEWAINLLRQCAHAGVRFHFKQWGEYAPAEPPRVVPAKVLSVDVVYVAFREDGGHTAMARVGVKKAGRTLAGREHLERLAA